MLLICPLTKSSPQSVHPLCRFEEGYKTEHGRFPRGAEKAALASTYAQYRAWKRLVKEDAARYVVWDMFGDIDREWGEST